MYLTESGSTNCPLQPFITDMFSFGKDRLSVGFVLDLLKKPDLGILSEAVVHKITQNAGHVSKMASGDAPVYGINTGFGPLCDTLISPEQTAELQHNLLISHSVGVGDPISETMARTMLICKVHALAQGFSGVQPQTIAFLLTMVREGITPIVPEKGSVGASGDLAPLAHLFLPLLGLGEVFFQGKRQSARGVLEKLGLSPIQLGPKEGLALINGTQFMLAHAVHGVARLHHHLEWADVIGALSIEALMGSVKPFESRLHDLRPFRGNQLVAQRLRKLINGSEVLASHAECGRVQDPYSLRCMPQVHGASRNAWLHLKEVTEIELNAVTDNPVVLGPEEALSGGNFHGQPIALPLDYATVAAAELGNIADRRCYLMLEGRYGLPRLLLQDTGLNSGFMIPQYTTAALVSENKSLCFPASADSIPTSLGQEDHVSMGSISGRKLHIVLDNLAYIQAIELLYATQAIAFRRPLKSSPIIEEIIGLVRKKVNFATQDKVLSSDIYALHQLILSDTLTQTLAAHEDLNDGFESFGLY